MCLIRARCFYTGQLWTLYEETCTVVIRTKCCSNTNLPQVRLSKTVRGPMVMAKLHNKLPLDIRQFNNKDFKTKLNHFLYKQSFYYVEEYMAKVCTKKDFYYKMIFHVPMYLYKMLFG